MEEKEQLAALIGELLEVPEQQIGPDFLLNHRKISGSVGRAILSTAIKSRLGKTINVAGVDTFGQLLAACNGALPQDESSAATAAPAVANRLIMSDGPSMHSGCGVDIESVDAMPETDDYWQHSFYEASFTRAETAYCVSQAEPRQYFAARWCAKEALCKFDPQFQNMQFNQIQVAKRGDGSVFIQVANRDDGWIQVPVAASISHTPLMAVAMVVGGTMQSAAPEQPAAALAEPATSSPPIVDDAAPGGTAVNRAKASFIKRILKRILGRA